jgi:hypothetical protein
MSSLEIMLRNVHFNYPERIGLRFDRIAKIGDVKRIFVLPAREGRDPTRTYSVSKKVRPVEGYTDEWGCFWTSKDESGGDMGQVINVPLADWNDFDNFFWPDPYAEGRWDGIENALEEADKRQLYVLLNSPHCIFERMHFLHGFEDTLIDCMINQDNIAKLARKLADFQIGIIERGYRLGQSRINCYDTTDDWGTQSQLMMNPEIFRKIFKPEYKRIFDKAHECGMDVRFHTDGKVNEIIEDLIEIGVNILNIHQPRLVGIDEMSEIARGRVCFEAAVDIQSTLPTCDYDRIEEEVKELCEKWNTPKGGLIGVEYGYPSAIGTTKEAILYSLEMFQKYGMQISY